MKKHLPSRSAERARQYPRPPRVEPTSRLIVVEFAGQIVATSRRALRVVERDHAPSYFLPMEDVRMDLLAESRTRVWCEWKGQAHCLTLRSGRRISEDAAWHFPRPLPEYRSLRDHVAFHPDRVGSATVDGMRAHAQPGGYYGGWVTDDVIGPFRGLVRLSR